MAGLKTLVTLSFVLAIGFLLVILSSALWKNYLPLVVVATFVVAPIPNWLCGRAASGEELIDSDDSLLTLGRFWTAFLVVMGVALPAVFTHAGLITIPAMIMSIVGGLLIYGTILTFTMFFQEPQEF